jgi:hypothetical protein
MPDTPKDNPVAVNFRQETCEQHSVVVVLGLLHGIHGIALCAIAGTPTTVVVDEDRESRLHEFVGPIGKVVLFE